jgi:hypothetical protein
MNIECWGELGQCYWTEIVAGGKRYGGHMHPYQVRYLQKLIAVGAIGKAWALVRKHEFTRIGE